MPSFDALDEVFEGTRAGYSYSRNGNPTVQAFESAVAALEGASVAVAFSSGMAAIHAALLAASVQPGDTILATRDCYGLTRTLLSTYFARIGVRTELVDMTNLDAVERGLTRRPRVLYLETLSNPLLIMLDIAKLVALAARRGTTVVVDNTFASPYLLRPLEHGVQLVVHSATKYIGGHGDVTGGTVAVSDAELGRLLHEQTNLLGANLAPNEAWLCHRGLKTLPLRMARQCANALDVARWLETHAAVARVYYPGLSSHCQHDLAGRLLGGRYGAMIAFDLREGTRDAVRRLMDRFRLVTPAPTLGDLRTLVLYPAQASHRGLTPEERRAVGIGDGLVRLSVGIEDPADLIADLERALQRAG